MKIKSVPKEELVNMSYDDVAYIVLKEKGKKIKTLDLFNEVSENMGLDPQKYEDKIGDFFTLLATEKRFIQLEKGYWDLRENHQVKIEIPESDDDMEEVYPEEEIEDENEDFFDEIKDVTDDETDDDLKDLVIIDDENIDEGEI